MANRMQNIANLFSDVKTRTIIIFTGVILLGAIIVGIVRLGASSRRDIDTATQVAGSRVAEGTPGGQRLNPEERKLAKEQDVRRAEQAKQTGGSAVPSILRETDDAGAGTSEFTFGEPLEDPTSTAEAKEKANNTAANAQQSLSKSSRNNQRSVGAQQLAQLQKQLQDQQQQVQEQQLAMEQQDQALQQQRIAAIQQQMSDSMLNQAQAMLSSWATNPQQEYVAGEQPVTEQEVASSAGGTNGQTVTAQAENGDKAEEPKPPATIKAGDIMYAVLKTAINTDNPGPILATIVTGKYRGAKLIGSLQEALDIPGTNGPTAVTLNFNTMSLKRLPNTIGISAVAIDTETARTAIASEVDHHYLYRYGTLFASSFLEGYGNAISQSGSVLFNDANGGSTQFLQELNPTEQILAGLGQVGSEFASQLSDVFDRPNTITVEPGTSLGILFLDDVTIG